MMAKYSYLEIVRSIVEDLNGLDNPETIYTLDQTLQSTMVKRIVKEVYYQIISGRDWPHLYQLFSLTETSASTPTHLTIPATVVEFSWIKYDKIKSGETQERYSDIIYKDPKDFIDMLETRNNDNSNVDIITDPSGITLKIINDKDPQYWTSFDDSYVVFDSYNSDVDTYLTTAKNKCRGRLEPVVTESDTFEFDLPLEAYSWHLTEAKSQAYFTLSDKNNPKIDKEADTQRRRMSNRSHKNTNRMGINFPNYGRRGKK